MQTRSFLAGPPGLLWGLLCVFLGVLTLGVLGADSFSCGQSAAAAVDTSMSLDTGGGFSMASADGDAVPMVRVPPQYPERALQLGIEGRVLIEFTISRSGAVKNAKVIAAEPSSIFNKAAIKAVEQWKYNPKIVNGQAVEQVGVRIAIPFKLGNDAG